MYLKTLYHAKEPRISRRMRVLNYLKTNLERDVVGVLSPRLLHIFRTDGKEIKSVSFRGAIPGNYRLIADKTCSITLSLTHNITHAHAPSTRQHLGNMLLN